MEASMRIPSVALCLLVLSAPVSAAVERPWEISLGPQKVLWIAEPMEADRLDMDRLDMDAAMKSAARAAGEQHDDVLGVAFSPEFGMGAEHDVVYVALAYDSGTTGAAADRRSRIVQYQWDAEAQTLSDPLELRSGLPAG
jgi:glucose/arabinose dehydrogenase